MSKGSKLWCWLWGPSKKSSNASALPPPDQVENLNEINADIDAHRAYPRFDRYTWRQWLLLQGPWPFSLTFRKPSDVHPILFSTFLYVMIYAITLAFIAGALIYFLTPVFQAYIARLWAAADGIF